MFQKPNYLHPDGTVMPHFHKGILPIVLRPKLFVEPVRVASYYSPCYSYLETIDNFELMFVNSTPETEREMGRAEKIRHLLNSTNSTDLKELQSLSYSGLPFSVRGTAWKLLAVRNWLLFKLHNMGLTSAK